MSTHIITIARGLGSGGSHIGKKLSKELGIPYYDTEILNMASDLSGINEEYFFKANEKIDRGLISIDNQKGVYTGRLFQPTDKQFLSNENLFNYQAKIIQNLAKEDGTSCIIIGKAANYILRNNTNILRVNIQAPIGYCMANVIDRTHISEKDAESLIQKTNKYRSDYYKYYTGNKWLDPSEYDITLNSEFLGEDYCAELIQTIFTEKTMKL